MQGVQTGIDFQNALTLVYSALDKISELYLPGNALPHQPDLVLVGDHGRLDSLALTTLILDLEDRLRAITGHDILLMQESELDTLTDSFRTPSLVAGLIVRNSLR